MITKIIYVLKTYGVKKSLEYVLLELDYMFRKVIKGSYSQRSEDLFLQDQFSDSHKGFYVDVGANDPFRFNNTYLFYKKGWNGINIEPDYASSQRFIPTRPRDINLNVGVGEESGMLTYHRFNPDTLNTFSREEAESYVDQGFSLVETKEVPVERLDTLLDKHLPEGTQIDFLSVDTEGFDSQVLRSASLDKYKPSYICIEYIKHETSGNNTVHPTHQVLTDYGYEEVYNNGLNAIYKKI